MDSWEKELQEFDEHFKQVMAQSEALPDGLQIGKIFAMPVADGEAYYEIVKINKTTVRLKWRKDLCPDEYQDRFLGDGGTFSKRIIGAIVDSEDRVKKLFAKK